MRLAGACVAGILATTACREGAGPAKRIPASLAIVSAPSTGMAGTVAGQVVVSVTDAAGDPVPGTLVTFAISAGGGRATPASDTTKADGTTSTALTLSTIPGQNELTVVTGGLAPLELSVTGTAAATQVIALSPRLLRMASSTNSAFLLATARDSFGNNTGGAITWTSRDPSLVTAEPGQGGLGVVSVVSRPGQTYVVAAAGEAIDSTLVAVQGAGASPCTFISAPSVLAVGGTLSFDDGVACIRSDAAGAEYAVVAHYGTTVTTVSTSVTMLATGVVAPTSAFPVTTPAPGGAIEAPQTRLVADGGFELALRRRERLEIASRVAGARAWFRARNEGAAARAALAAIPATAREGDVVQLNVNAFDFCASPEARTARVAAITDGTVVLADLANPAGGFTDAEYRAFGVAMDTLVNPVDTTAFGAPSDIDGNRRVAILFTSAVNELSQRGSASIVLGFYYARDLLPKQSAAGACPGSNVAEMFYLLVPDVDGAVSDARSKEFVQNISIATIAHEYQHLINASRRMYVNGAPSADEEVWLNEGLSHIAEELVFYRTSQLSPRQNIGAAQLGDGTLARTTFESYQRANVVRYQHYLLDPDANSPIVANDLLATRGATWSFLRYLADRTRSTDGDFWFRLVNSTRTGALNLDEVLRTGGGGAGLTTLSAMRDWSVSVFTDDAVGGASPQQASWDFVSVIPGVLSSPYGLAPAPLPDAISTNVAIRGGGTVYRRFGVAQSQEALLHVTSAAGGRPPRGTSLTIVRIK